MDNKPLTDWEKWQQTEALLRETGRDCAKMSGYIHDLRTELSAPGMPFKIEGGWKVIVGNTVGLGATPGDAIDAAFEALHGDLMDRMIDTEVELAKVRAMAAEAREAWVPVTERLPPLGQEVDLWDGFGRLADCKRDGDESMWDWFNVNGDPIGDVPGTGEPTHWREKPLPPNG